MPRAHLLPRFTVLRTDGARVCRGPARAATGWYPRVDHRRRVPGWRLHAGRIPFTRGTRTRFRGPRHGHPRLPPRPICLPDVGAPGPSVQLLLEGLQIPLHPEETARGVGRLNMERKEDWTPEISRAIVDGLRKRVRAEAVRRGDGIVEHVGKNWISWRSRKRGLVFAEIRSLRGRIQVFILPRPHELHNG